MNKTAVITGATGTIGMALTRLLLEKDYSVLVLIRKNSRRAKQIQELKKEEKYQKNLIIIPAGLEDLAEKDILMRFPKERQKADIWFHLAWEGTFGTSRNDMELQIRNIQHTLDAVRAAKQLDCKVFVGAGSQAEYGRIKKEEKLTKDTPVFPENGYGIAKLAAGQMSRILCRELKIRHEWARILSVYGAFDGENTMIMSAVTQLLEGKRPQFSKGEQYWDYLNAKDAANALYCMAEKGEDGKIYPVGSGEIRQLKEYIAMIRNTINPKAEIGIGELPYQPNQVMYLCADISELTEDTGFLPEVSFEEGIRETIEWCKRKRQV